MPSLQVMLLAAGLVAILYTLVPEGRWRNNGKWLVTGLVALAALSRIALGADAPTDVLVGVALGVTFPLVAFRWFAPNEIFPITYRGGSSAHLDVSGPRGTAIRRGLEEQLGLLVEEVKPFGLAGSAGSTPLRITVKGDPPTYLFGKLYARSHLRSDRWYKLGRELLYGRLEDEKPFNTVRRLVQQEDYALSLMRSGRAPQPDARTASSSSPPSGSTCWSPSSSTAPPSSARPRSTTQVIDDGLGIIRKLWDAGLAHRDIKPANLLVRDGRMLLIDVAFVQARPSPWRQAVDLANMMLCLALRSEPASWSTSGPCASSRSRRSPRGSPPPAGWPCPRSCAGCSGPRAATCTPSSSACCRPRPSRCRSSAGAPAGSGFWPSCCSWWCSSAGSSPTT